MYFDDVYIGPIEQDDPIVHNPFILNPNLAVALKIEEERREIDLEASRRFGFQPYDSHYTTGIKTEAGTSSKLPPPLDTSRPYECEICEKRFNKKSNLWKHIHIHTGEKRFQCDVCNKKFSQNANLKKHKLIHDGIKPYSCTYCQKAFTQRANLDKHIRIHTGEKPYGCIICNNSFAQQSNLHKHMLIHQGVKYQCEDCTATFTQKANLKKHMERHLNRQQNCEFFQPIKKIKK
ncbi:PREDICTED: zinc finger protein 70-like [Nicrophorus vespilloides]|uniref:Zinc finger protein 70-like n=1 Tax=Nicrophorus vespilloides TaxID=110193 RepID=A0ABM1MNM7_NICVS|nr:PREDICTED: zinc finger protein 70-like [Nicrophorus vespilloides]